MLTGLHFCGWPMWKRYTGIMWSEGMKSSRLHQTRYHKMRQPDMDEMAGKIHLYFHLYTYRCKEKLNNTKSSSLMGRFCKSCTISDVNASSLSINSLWKTQHHYPIYYSFIPCSTLTFIQSYTVCPAEKQDNFGWMSSCNWHFRESTT